MRWYYLLRVSPGLPKAPEAIDCVGCLKHKFEPAYIARRDQTSQRGLCTTVWDIIYPKALLSNE